MTSERNAGARPTPSGGRNEKPDAREKLLDAALTLFREHGYAATAVDALCAAAGVTKGAFFHHFASKEELGAAAANHWSATTGAFFRQAPYHEARDPLDRLLAYIDFRKAILRGPLPAITCVAGTLVQETYDDSGAIRAACRAAIFDHAETLVPDIEAAMAKYGVGGDFTARSLALHTQAVLQGAFILAKADGDVRVAEESVDHLRRYVERLFHRAAARPPSSKGN